MGRKKIGILTGGGDAPGLNAVIYTLIRACRSMKLDYDIIGYKFGYRGLYNNDFIPLTVENTSGILHKGGTILKSSNKDNLFKFPVEVNGVKEYKDESDIAIENMKKEGVEVLVVLGGDGTLTSARDFARKRNEHNEPEIKVIGIPKTIDNDLRSTDTTFGFDTAVNIVVENLGRLHTTAESHQRVIVVEVMGRNAGWIALHSGIAGSADVILIPEIPYSLDKIIQKVEQRNAIGKNFTIVVVTEGAAEKGGKESVAMIVADSPEAKRLGGVARKIAEDLAKANIENEVRHCVLGHIQRGGEPSPVDRLLSVRYGEAAAQLIKDQNFGNMVCLRNGEMSYVSLEKVIGAGEISETKTVSPNHELIRVARSLGISFAEAD
ncbi:MAG: ATP-dependent 6-phosphofructokinase [Clostridiales bacterium]|jgi:6-phosphofructokinase 1|nr:ATP-dependent 6-phosphofructokinase [Clostridiales bacterium]